MFENPARPARGESLFEEKHFFAAFGQKGGSG
jgi:hypothetical protein